jgi:glycosyltransferase involved in cell wall biosynthesis
LIDPQGARPVTISIGIPAYRGAAHIGAAIESVLAQSFGDFELIVIDDDSPDDTYAIASAYRDPRVRCLRNGRNLGPQGNWNRCLDEAAGRYFRLLPQDDLLTPDCLRRQLEVLEADTRQELALVFSARTILNERGQPILERRPFGRQPQRLTGAALFRRCLHRGTNVIGEPGGVMFRLDLAKTIGAFDATFPYVVDLDYWLRLLAYGDGYYLPDCLASFRVSARAWSVVLGARQSAQFAGLMARKANEGHWRAGAGDLMMARVLASTNNLARLMLYRVMFRGSAQ